MQAIVGRYEWYAMVYNGTQWYAMVCNGMECNVTGGCKYLRMYVSMYVCKRVCIYDSV